MIREKFIQAIELDNELCELETDIDLINKAIESKNDRTIKECLTLADKKMKAKFLKEIKTAKEKKKRDIEKEFEQI